MTIDQILNDKGRTVIAILATKTLKQAAELLDEKRIGAVVTLTPKGEIMGVLSERDIVRQFARNASAALEMLVQDAMTREVITIDSGTQIETALQLMTDRRVRHLPVLRDGKLCGVVSIGDLVKWKIAETTAEADAMKSYLSAQF